jgi:HlyD family secretion protein
LLDIPEREVPRVNATEQNPNPDGQGDRVTVRIPSLKEVASGGEFQGTITRLGSAVDPATRTMRAEVHLDNRSGHLRPGMYGTASVLLEERSNVMTLPATALQRRGNQTEVFCVEGATGEPLVGFARRIEIELGLDDGQRVHVLAGLSGKELVIARGNGVIREGDKVVAVPARAAEP